MARHLGNWCTPQEKQLHEDRGGVSWFHPHPGSVFVAVTGDVWDDFKCREAVDAMVDHHNASGFHCYLEEVPDVKSTFPEPDLASMMDMGVSLGRDSGCEFTALIETDVLPEPDILLRLMEADLPIVAPILTTEFIGSPHRVVDIGLKRMNWLSSCFVLFKSNVLNCPVSFKYGGEGHFYKQLDHFGHKPWMSTDVRLKVTRPPKRTGLLLYDQREAGLKARYDRDVTRARENGKGI